VVDETANVPDAAKKIVWGAMAWGGQWCTSPGYAYGRFARPRAGSSLSSRQSV
jgi:hypothetical protein